MMPVSRPWTPGLSRPLDPDAVSAWQARVERASRKAQEYVPQWERALKRYAEPKVAESKSDINALLDYRHVESKKAQLFHRTPEINLIPKPSADPTLPLDAILPLREQVLNYELGPSAANAKRAMHATLIDALAASGWMILELGYEDVKLPVPPDPLTGMQPTGLDGQPLQIPIWARRFIAPISSKSFLVPDDWYRTDFDAAPWLGLTGTISLAAARRSGWAIPEGFEGTVDTADRRFDHGEPKTDPESKVCYTKIWYRASEYDETVFNPELFRCLILVEGVESAVFHVDSPYQALTPQGALTDDSLIGNPIHVGTLRDIPDSAYVPSDLVVGEQLSTEVNKFRTDLIRNRRKRMPLVFVSDSLGQPILNKIEKNEGPIPVPSTELLAGKEGLALVLNPGTEPRDNYTAQDYAEKDWEQALGVSANQTGQFNRSKRTATEVRTVQGNSSARAEVERDRIREYFVALVRKFDCLVQRTATEAEVVKILGAQGSQLWQQWRALPGRYAYDIQPDSGIHQDAQEYRSQKVNEYNLLRKDPLINAPEYMKSLIRALGMDPGKIVLPNLPTQKPEPPKLNFSMGAQELTMPGVAALLLSLLQQSGYQIPPEVGTLLAHIAVAPGMPPSPDVGHGGSADRTEPINQHQTERTGGVQGLVS